MKLWKSSRVLGGALAVIAFLLASKQIVDHDLFWHLAAGRWMWAHGEVVKSDPFSFTFQGQPWVSITWGYELLCYLISRFAGGLEAVSALHALVAALAICAVWAATSELRARDNAASARGEAGLAEAAASALLFLAAMTVVELRWTTRPEVFAHLWGALLVWNFCRRWENPRLGLGLAIAVQIAWVNTHGTFLFGPFVAAAYAVGARVESGRWNREKLGAVIGMVLACLLNPRGITGALFPFHLLRVLGGAFYQNTIPEATRPLGGAIGWGFDSTGLVLWIALLSAAFAWGWRKERRTQPFIAFAIFSFPLLWVSLSARRNIPLLVLWTLPFVANAVASAFTAALVSWRQGLARGVAPTFWILTLALAGAIPTDYYRNPLESARWGWGLRDYQFSEGVGEFLKRWKLLDARIFSSVETASYLLYRTEGFRPYIDSRFAEVYSEEHFAKYMRIIANPQLFDREAREQKLDGVCVSAKLPIVRPFISYLAQHPGWRLAYLDEAVVVFLNRNYPKLLGEDPGRAAWERLVGEATQGEWKIPFFKRINSRFMLEDRPRGFYFLAETAAVAGKLDLAARALDQSLAMNARYAPALTLRCTVEYLGIQNFGDDSKGVLSRVESECKDAAVSGNDPVMAWQTLGLLYYSSQRFNEAVAAFGEAVRADSGSYPSWIMLGRSLEAVAAGKGDTAEMEKAYARAATLRPFDAEPWAQLGSMFESRRRWSEAASAYARAIEIEDAPELRARLVQVKKNADAPASPPSR